MAAAGIPLAGLREWITPREQLERVRESSPVLEQFKAVLSAPRVLKIALAYTADPCIAAVSRAFEALRKIDMLPARIPALPRHIHHILNSKCPIRRHKAMPDETSLKVWQTHALYLIPPGTLNELEARISAYGREHLTEYGGANPLRFSYFWSKARGEHGDTQFNEPHWMLISNVLPGSRGKPYTEQVQVVEDLSAKSFTTYEVPSIKEAVAFALLHKIATGESVLREGNEQNGHCYTYTRVKETTEENHFVVGGSAPSGVHVYEDDVYVSEGIGVVARRKL